MPGHYLPYQDSGRAAGLGSGKHLGQERIAAFCVRALPPPQINECYFMLIINLPSQSITEV